MPCNISFRDIQFSPSSSGVRIRAWTDVPAHLYVRLSSQKPRVHRKPSLRRGVQFAEDVRFCFTVFEDNEQEEAGDTLEHTWNKPAWPFCTIKYLYLFGSIDGEICPSTTAPMSYHNDFFTDFPGIAYDSGDGSWGNAPDTPLSWPTAHNATSARWWYFLQMNGWWVARVVSYRNYISGYLIFRNWIFFDTSLLWAGWQDFYSTVKLRLYIPAGTYFWKAAPPTAPLENGYQTSRGDIIVTVNKAATRPPTKSPGGCDFPNCRLYAYGAQHDFPENGGAFYFVLRRDAGHAAGFYEAVLNDLGKDFITPGGFTGFCLRTRTDCEDNSPGMLAGEVNEMFYAHPDAGLEYRAELVFS
ncbi:hypothetical protein ES705_14101 [subsurface metagenome]